MQRFSTLLRFGLAVVLATTVSFAHAQDDQRAQDSEQAQDSQEDQDSDEDNQDSDEDNQDDEENEPTLTIGSQAPQLDIEHWLSDDDGLFPKIKKFEADKIYVIDFWSPRSPASIVMMHKMGELQSQYVVDDVQIISICIDDLDTVEDFLEKPTFGGEEGEPKKTFADLTRSYCLTSDPDKSVWNDYYIASGRRYPTFIVGKTGLIEWIGSSARMSEPLDQIIEGDWDRNEFKKKFAEQQAELDEARKKAIRMRRKLTKAMRGIQEKIQDGDEEAAIVKLAEMTSDEDLEPAKPELLRLWVQLMVNSDYGDMAVDLEKFVEDNKEDGSALNSVNWRIYELFEERGGDIDTEVLEIARKGSEYAAKAEPESGAILDTLAHYIYIVDEDLDKAIEVQRKAVEHAGSQLEDIKPFLDELLQEKETGKSKKKQKKDESDF